MWSSRPGQGIDDAEALFQPTGIDGVLARTALFEQVVEGLQRPDHAASRA